jgi:hypothetical protein
MAEEQSIGRRRMLRGAGAAAGGVAVSTVALASPALADGGHSRVAGSWMIVHQDDADPAEVKAVISFALGGVFISHDISPAGPPFTGTWERRGHDRFRATFWSGFPGDEGPGSAGPTIRIRARGQVDGDEISGTFTFTVFDPGGEVVDSASGTFSGERIDA